MARSFRLTRARLKIIEHALAEGMTRTEIANLVGVTYGTIWNWWNIANESNDEKQKIFKDLKQIIDAAESKEIETAINRIAAYGAKKREKLVRKVRIHEEVKGYKEDGTPIFQIVARVTSDESTDTEADWKAIAEAIKLKYPHRFNTKQLEHSGEIDGLAGQVKVVFEDIDTTKNQHDIGSETEEEGEEEENDDSQDSS